MNVLVAGAEGAENLIYNYLFVNIKVPCDAV
jgi:hypothetical protein